MITRIALTGGPCAGKSAGLKMLLERLQKNTGIKVFCSPEPATLLVEGGLDWSYNTPERFVDFQCAFVKTQVSLEDTFYILAKSYNEPCVIVSDRGAMDGQAFVSEEQFEEVAARMGSTIDAFRDRYDAVIHLATAAKGAEKFYNHDNPARHETLEEARESDTKLQKAYVGQPKVVPVLNASGGFPEKLDVIYQTVCETCGVASAPADRQRRFRTAAPDTSKIDVVNVATQWTVVALSNSTKDDRHVIIDRSTTNGHHVYFYQRTVNGVVKDFYRIDKAKFDELVPHKAAALSGNMINFVWKDDYYEWFTVTEGAAEQSILFVDRRSGERVITAALPPFVGSPVEVTDEVASLGALILI